jgi:hypothetical protein
VTEPGDYELCVRATSASGETQPLGAEDVWNRGGYGVNVVQRVPVRVSAPASGPAGALH